MSSSRNIHSYAGFTLIELLSVICVAAILMALLFPAAGHMIERGNEAKCLSNLRQIGAGLNLYAADNSGNLPPQYWYTHGASPFGLTSSEGANGLGFLLAGGYLGGTSTSLVGEARSKVLRCPSKPSAAFFDLNGNGCSYVYQNPFPQPDGQPDPDRPNKTVAVKAGYALVIDASQNYGGHPPPHGSGSQLHTGVLYGDGHAEMRSYIDSSSAPWGVNPNRFDLVETRDQ